MMGNEILDGLEFIPDGGALMFRDVRYLLIRPETIIEVQKALEDEVGSERAGQAFYRAGFRGGSLSSQKFRRDLDLDPVDIVRFMAKMGGQIGWGRMEIEKIDPQSGVLEMDVYHSVFAEAYGSSGAPVCHMIRGVFAGTWEGALSRSVNGLETRCRASDGPGPCRFIFSASSDKHLDVSYTGG